MKNLPLQCPSCDNRLKVKSMECHECGTVVSGNYEMPVLANLSREEQEFVVAFMKESGRLNVMAKQFNLSYPTVRNRLDDVIEKIKTLEKELNQEEK